MSVNAAGWLDWTIPVPGPEWKTNGARSGLYGIVGHSAEGYERALRNILAGADRKSWTFSNLKDGRCLQHYSVYAQVWASGAAFPNNNMPAVESEGTEHEALTVLQERNMTRLIRDISAAASRPKVERIGNRQAFAGDVFAVVEHGECVRWGATATACPSGRYKWERILPEEEDVKPYLVWEFERKRVYLVGPGGAVWVTKQETVEELKRMYGPIEKRWSAGLVAAHGG